jgi:hypothetical protein
MGAGPVCRRGTHTRSQLAGLETREEHPTSSIRTPSKPSLHHACSVSTLADTPVSAEEKRGGVRGGGGRDRPPPPPPRTRGSGCQSQDRVSSTFATPEMFTGPQEPGRVANIIWGSPQLWVSVCAWGMQAWVACMIAHKSWGSTPVGASNQNSIQLCEGRG